MPPLQLNVHRGLCERDVVWHHNQVYACVRINDCSAKLVPIYGDWTKAQVHEIANGIRVCPSVCVGDPQGPSAYRPNDRSPMWFMGRLEPGQIIKHEVTAAPLTRERQVLGTVLVPMPGFAEPSRRRRRPVVEVEKAEDAPALEPSVAPASSASEMSLLSALESAALSAAAIALEGAHSPGDPAPA